MNFSSLDAELVYSSYDGVKSSGKFWTEGDTPLFIFPVTHWVQDKPAFPVAMAYGHSVNLGETYKRSFLPTTSELDENRQPKNPDFAYHAAGIARALRQGEYEMKKLRIERDYADNEQMKKVELDSLEEWYKDAKPVIGGLFPRTYTEILVGKLDGNLDFVNGEIKLNHASMQISPTKLRQLYQLLKEEGSCVVGEKYVYVYMRTSSSEKKQKAGQNPWKVITDSAKRLEAKYPTFAKMVEDAFEQANITSETIKSRSFDFKPYNLPDFKTAVANYVTPRTYFLKDLEGNYFDFVRREENVELLRSINLVAQADVIKALLAQEEQANTPTTQNAEQAQSFDIEMENLNNSADDGVPFEFDGSELANASNQ